MPKNNSSSKIAIIGAGASALLASIILAKRNFAVTVFEKNPKAGKKLLATGNGKCNITNKNLSLKHFFSSNLDFIRYPIESFGFGEFVQFCDEIGLNLTTTENGKTYPSSLQASSVVDVLYNVALFYGVKFHFNSEVKDIDFQEKAHIICDAKKYIFDKIIVATGSIAMEKLGGSESGYRFGQKFGHTLIKPIPSLVQLTSNDKEIYPLNGVKTEANITLYINNKQQKTVQGDILFTNYGVSGNSILDLSRDANIALLEKNQLHIVVDIFPQLDKNKLLALLEKKKKHLLGREKEFLLVSLINNKLIEFIFKKAKIANHKKLIDDLDKKDLQSLTFALKSIKITIEGSKGFENAEVVAGGICVDEIDNKTMESKKQKGLYFCGEVVDVDGACGGYNLHWAWASAFVLSSNMR
jgi:predicted Rossmann fold flavoprotein